MGSRSQTTQALPPWALPYAQGFLGKANDLSNTPYNPNVEQGLAPFNPTQQAGLNYLTDTAAPSATLAGSGINQLQSTLAGNYLSPESNPYIDATYNAAARNAVNQYTNAIGPGNIVSAQQGGVAGGSADVQNQALSQFNLGQNLTDLAAQMFGANYAGERQIQAQAPNQIGALQGALAQPGQQLLGAGTLQQGQQQAGMDVSTGNALLRQQYPFTLNSYLGNAIGTATGGGGQATAGTSK
jgi:hypothetical protein